VTKSKAMERNEIETVIPHRPPFLWIDRVEELEPGVRCVAVKFVDPFVSVIVPAASKRSVPKSRLLSGNSLTAWLDSSSPPLAVWPC